MRDSRDADRRSRPRDDLPARGGSAWLIIVPLGLGAVVLLAGAGGAAWYFLTRGETTEAVIQRYRPAFAQQRAKLKRVADGLPPSGSVTRDALPPGLDPRPTYDVENKHYNTAILMAEQCADPDHHFDERSLTRFDLNVYEDEFLTHLKWTGDRNPMVGSALQTRHRDFPEQLERTLGFRYLVVVRTLRYEPPVLVGDKSFVGGEVEFEAFLVDLQSEKVLGGFRRAVHVEPQVMVTRAPTEDAAGGLRRWVYSQLWQKARKEVAAALSQGTGGAFVLDRPIK